MELSLLLRYLDEAATDNRRYLCKRAGLSKQRVCVFQILQFSVNEIIVLTGWQAAATRSMDFTCAGNAVQLLGIQNIMGKRAALQLCIKL